jgi:Helix-turn-helix domain
MTQGNTKWFCSQLNDVLNNKKLPLKPTERLLLHALASRADKSGRCSVYLNDLAFHMGIDKKNVPRYLKILKKHKIITIKTQFQRGNKCMTKNSYQINIKAIIDLSIDKNGHPVIEGSHHIDVTMEPICTEKDDRGSVNMTLGSHQYDGVKTRSNLKSKLELKDIVHGQFPNTNLHKIPVSRFDEFWAAYPRKQDKAKARKAWNARSLDLEADKIIEDILMRSAKDVQWQNKEYIPLASTYINGERWNDEVLGVQHNGFKSTQTNHAPYESPTAKAMREGFEDFRREEARRTS